MKKLLYVFFISKTYKYFNVCTITVNNILPQNAIESCRFSHAAEAKSRVVTANPKSFQFGKVDLSDERACVSFHAFREH